MSNVVSNVKTHVNNKFTEEEKTVFNFIIESFPEYLLVDNLGNNNEDILALLALIAKAIGSSRELINNLATAHSVQELYDKIDANYLRENNLELLLLLIEDLNVPLFKNKTRDEKIALLEDKGIRDLVINSYLLTRDRGTKTAIKNIIDLTLKNLLHSTEIEDTEDVLKIIEDKGQSLIYLKSDKSITENDTTVYPIEELIDFSLSNHEPLEFFVSNEFIDNVFYLKTDTPMYQTIMAYKPSGIIYNAVVKYLSHNLFMNKANDFVITKDNQSLVYYDNLGNNDIELKNIIEPLLLTNRNSEWISQINGHNEFAYKLEFQNTNKYAPLRLVICDNITEERHDEIVLKPAELKTIAVNFTSENFEEINISYWFENIYNKKIKSNEGELIGTRANGNVKLVTLNSPVLTNNNDGSITIANNNPARVSIEIKEKWIFNDKVYGTTTKQIDNIYNNYVYKPINISSKHVLNVELSVSFKWGELTSTKADITLKNIPKNTTSPILDEIVLTEKPEVSVEVRDHGYIPHMSITNSNPNFVDCEITYSYYNIDYNKLIATETYNFLLSPTTTTNNIPLRPCPPTNAIAVLNYIVTFKHENSNIETSTIHNDTIAPNVIYVHPLPISPEGLRPYDLELVKGKWGYMFDSGGYIEPKVTLVESLPLLLSPYFDPNILESFVEFKIRWYDSATSEFLSEQIELVNTPTTPGGKSYKKWIGNPYNRQTNAKVYVRAFVRFKDNKLILVQSKTIEGQVNNITNTYGGI